MAVFSIGEVIRKQRENLDISQEDLCDGICSVPTLSRIENGERVPSKANFDALMQRMGQSGEMYDAYIGKQDFDVYELKYNIRVAVIEKKFSLAEELMVKLKSMPNIRDNLTQQFLLYMEECVSKKGRLTKKSIDILEKAIKYTMPKYGTVTLHDQLMTFDEITILNNIANACAMTDNLEKGIEILYELKEFMENKYVNAEEKMRNYPLILYNLSKWLGLAKKYGESINICDVGIEISKRSGRISLLGNTMFNKAWCLAEMHDLTRQEECKKLLLQSYYIATATGNQQVAELIKDYGTNNCLIIKQEYFL